MVQTKKLVIFGTTASGKIAHHYFSTDSDFEVVAFTVDSKYMQDSDFCNLPVVPFEKLTVSHPPNEYSLFIAMGYTGMNQQRAEKYYQGKSLGYEMATYVSSRCNYLSEITPGDNCLILEDNTIQPFVTIGANVVLWSGNHIGHDVVVGNHCFISSHVVVSGNTKIGECCFIGVNSTIRDNIEIGEKTLIGAGAVVMKSTDPMSVWVPAKSQRINAESVDLL